MDSNPPPQPWNLYVDGSFIKDGSTADLIIESPGGERHEHALKFMFKASNNEAEYETLIAGIKLCYIGGADLVRAFFDSWLVVSQLNGEYEAKDDTITAYVGRVREVTRLLKKLCNNAHPSAREPTGRHAVQIGKLL